MHWFLTEDVMCMIMIFENAYRQTPHPIKPLYCMLIIIRLLGVFIYASLFILQMPLWVKNVQRWTRGHSSKVEVKKCELALLKEWTLVDNGPRCTRLRQLCVLRSYLLCVILRLGEKCICSHRLVHIIYFVCFWQFKLSKNLKECELDSFWNCIVILSLKGF